MTQVAADALGLPVDRVRFALGDSNYPKAPSHSGSRTMASVGSAVFTVANMLRDKVVRTAVVDPGSPLNGVRAGGRHGGRRADVRHGGPGARRELSGPAAPARLAEHRQPRQLDARRRRQAVLDVRLRRGVRRGGRRRLAGHRPHPAHLRLLRRRAG